MSSTLIDHKVLIFIMKEKDLKMATSNKALVKIYLPQEGFPPPHLLTTLQRAKDLPVLLALAYQLMFPWSLQQGPRCHFLIFAPFPRTQCIAKAWRGFHKLTCQTFVEHLLVFIGCWRCTGGEDVAPAFGELILWVGDRRDIGDHYTSTEESYRNTFTQSSLINVY